MLHTRRSTHHSTHHSPSDRPPRLTMLSLLPGRELDLEWPHVHVLACACARAAILLSHTRALALQQQERCVEALNVEPAGPHGQGGKCQERSGHSSCAAPMAGAVQVVRLEHALLG